MTDIVLKDIQIKARQESFRMQHYFLGVEHLFIGLLGIPGGLTSALIEEHGLTAQYVIDSIRRYTGKGTRQRLWAGLPNTPRANMVLSIANDLALEAGRAEIDERALLRAIVEENDSIPIRILRRLGIDTVKLAEQTQAGRAHSGRHQPYLQVDFALQFEMTALPTEEQLVILRRMFYGYERVRVERRLTGGHTHALLLLVTPINSDGTEDAGVVVKIDQADRILDEAQRYETHVKHSLPPLTARLEDKPTTAEISSLAGIKYTFVAPRHGVERDLRSAAAEFGPRTLSEWLETQLYPTFGKAWWQQRQPYRFPIWTEYDWLLPPLLTLELLPSTVEEEPSVTIKDPVRRLLLHELEPGDIVAVENFTIHRLYPEREAMTLVLGKGAEAMQRANKIEVTGLKLQDDAHYRGEVIERLLGRVWHTRSDTLYHALSALEPDFDTSGAVIRGFGPFERLPNPLFAHDALLDRSLNGSLSKIHGDLHLGNILLGPNFTPFLIDFAHTGSGHTLFDWATLEASLISDVVMPTLGHEWEAARGIAAAIAALRTPETTALLPPPIAELLRPIAAVRKIAQDCLARPDGWDEYFTALAFAGLRALLWETMPLSGRRALFLLAAYAFSEALSTSQPGEPRSSDETELADPT